MSQTQAPAAGGQFLTTTAKPAEVFVREDLRDSQRPFGPAPTQSTTEYGRPGVEPLTHPPWTPGPPAQAIRGRESPPACRWKKRRRKRPRLAAAFRNW